MNDCLLLIDLQNDYFPGGSMELVDIEKTAAHSKILLNEFRKSDSPIIHIKHLSILPGATFFLPETDGAKINEIVAPLGDEIIITKNFPNSFLDTTLLETLRKKEIENLIICGAMSHMCIDATTRAAFDFGFNCTVIEDACTTRDLIFKGKVIKAADVHSSFMAALAFPYAKVVSTEDFISAKT
ncbi:cysteine hydrolase family protein [Thermodesulfobacteriota bacterium]